MSGLLLETKYLTKKFGHGRIEVLAVNNVSLTIKKGEIVLILGPSGSGKTTLLSMIGCILTPTRGEIILDGEPITETSDLPKIRRETIGFVFQSFNLLKSLTVQENAQIPLMLHGLKGKCVPAKAKEVLERVGLQERLDFYPRELSGGEKQRVSLARAIVTKPKLILADEPTGNLDSKTGQNIIQLLRTLVKTNPDTAAIIVTHDQRIEPFADRIYYLEDGMLQDMRTLTTNT